MMTSPFQQQQQQKQKRKFQPCKNNCGVMITWDDQLGRTPTGGWVPMERDSIGQIVKHECPNKKTLLGKAQASSVRTDSPPQQQLSNDLLKEVAAIKTQLLELVSRLDRIEQQEIAH